MKKTQILSFLIALVAITQGFGQILTQGTLLRTGEFTVTVYAKPDVVVPPGTSLGMLFAVSIDSQGETDPSNAPAVIGATMVTGPSFTPASVEYFNGRFVYPFGLEGTMTNGFAANADNPVATITFPNSLAGEVVQLNDYTGSGATSAYWYMTYNSAEGVNFEEMFYGSNVSNNYNGGSGDSWVEANLPLPVTLISFQAEKFQDRSSYLTWSTVSEINSSHFLVQRSLDKKVWTNAGKVIAAGNSQIVENYEFVDQNVYNGADTRLSVYYRLQMVDLDGQKKNSPIENVIFGNDAAFTKGLAISVYPNPATDGIQVEWDANNVDQPTLLEIYDVTGKLVLQQKISENANQEYIDFGPAKITSGLYLLRIMNGTEPIEHKQIVVGQSR